MDQRNQERRNQEEKRTCHLRKWCNPRASSNNGSVLFPAGRLAFSSRNDDKPAIVISCRIESTIACWQTWIDARVTREFQDELNVRAKKQAKLQKRSQFFFISSFIVPVIVFFQNLSGDALLLSYNFMLLKYFDITLSYQVQGTNPFTFFCLRKDRP